MNFIVTGALGFVGSHFVEILLEEGHKPLLVDKMTYASNEKNLPPGADVWCVDINHRDTISYLLDRYKPKAIFNFAAESHVCRSIEEPSSFIHSNINGTFSLLQESLVHWKRNPDFKFVQISTDEVFGDLDVREKPFNELSKYKPNSPYAASKAAADHLVKAWNHTYKLPTIITHCSNNYGPRQHREKLIPFMINKALKGEDLPIHGSGENVRDWIHVKDHCRGVWKAFIDGKPGQSYCFGGDSEYSNFEIVNSIKEITGSKSKITFVDDRPGNDRRYAIDNKKAVYTLGWNRKHSFPEAFKETVKWYMDSPDWGNE